MNKFFTSRKFKIGAYGTAVTAVVLALVLALNVVSIILTNRANAFIDLTAEKAFVLSDSVRDVFKNLSSPVKVTVLYDEKGYSAINPYCAQIEYILDEAVKENDGLTLRYIDPVENPELKASYPNLDCIQGDIIMENTKSGRSIEVAFSDLFFFDSSMTSITGSKAEAVIASRMVSLSSGETFKVAFSTGHGEQALSELHSQLELNNYTIEDVATTTNAVSEDTLCLVIAAPTVDFSEQEIKMLEDYLVNEGKYGHSLLYFASVEQTDMPNLEGLLANYGISIGKEIVCETNSNYVYGGEVSYALVGYLDSDYAGTAYTRGLASISPYTRPVDILFESSAKVRTKALLSFSPSSIAINPLSPENYRSGSEETIYGAVLSEIYNYVNGEGERVSRVVAFGSCFFADDTMLTVESLGNAEYLISVLAKLAPNEISIDVATKSILGGYMSISASQAKKLGIVFIGVIPLMVLAAGVYVYIRRRNR